MDMGFPEDMCREALERYDNDENLALNYLLGGWLHSFWELFAKERHNINEYCLWWYTLLSGNVHT